MCSWQGYDCQAFRDIPSTNGDTLPGRYDQTLLRLEQINRAGYQVKIQWECQFDVACKETPEQLAHTAVCRSPRCTRDALYGGRTEAMRFHYKAREGETIQFVDVMSLYPYICKYFKFPVGHPVIHVGDA